MDKRKKRILQTATTRALGGGEKYEKEITRSAAGGYREKTGDETTAAAGTVQSCRQVQSRAVEKREL